MIFRWYLQTRWAATSSSRHHWIYFFSDLYEHTKTSGLEVCPVLLSPRDHAKLLIQLQDAIIHPLCMAACGTLRDSQCSRADEMALTVWDPGSPPSPAHPAPVRLVQLCARGISNSSPLCRLQHITLNAENWQSEKPVGWEKECKESKQWFNTHDKSRTLFIISIQHLF